ncbi:MAG: hypothetical protein E6929_08145 [Clostridium sp.]|nr:hypothetical protein [Clostridium sp.]
MGINNINGNYSMYSNGLSTKTCEVKDSYMSKGDVKKTLEFKDSIEIAASQENISRASRVGGVTIDKGTAAHTTLYVDRGSFNQIVDYTTNNPDCQWEELGIDDEKRWVVVNGQRFECPLSEQEKEMRRRLRKGLVEILDEADKEMEKYKSKFQKKESATLTLDENNKVVLNVDENIQLNDKIKALMSNDKVMNMLADIMKMNKGQNFKFSI